MTGQRGSTGVGRLDMNRSYCRVCGSGEAGPGQSVARLSGSLGALTDVGLPLRIGLVCIPGAIISASKRPCPCLHRIIMGILSGKESAPRELKLHGLRSQASHPEYVRDRKSVV